MALRVLIADDSALVRAAVGKLFLSLGEWEILEACDGVEAIANADESKPDLIILDFAMPRMDGLEASRVLQGRFPQIPVLLYTLHYSEQLRREAQTAGIRKVVSKSETGELVAAVEELLTPRKSHPPSVTERSICTRKPENALIEAPAVRTAS